MPYYQGICKKMQTSLEPPNTISDSLTNYWQVNYVLTLNHQSLILHQQLGNTITIEFSGNIYCVSCGKKIKKSYAQGHCFRCLQTKASCDICMMQPHLCHFHQGTCREPDWADNVCFASHYVYLSNTSSLKVGITRATNLPYRWIDQGAHQAIILGSTNSRRMAGYVEDYLKQTFNDRTNWRKMLSGSANTISLVDERQRLQDEYPTYLTTLGFDSDDFDWSIKPELFLEYPVLNYPDKVKSLNLEKTPTIQGTLQGIKGQYLILDIGVINLRKYTGYQISITL